MIELRLASVVAHVKQLVMHVPIGPLLSNRKIPGSRRARQNLELQFLHSSEIICYLQISMKAWTITSSVHVSHVSFGLVCSRERQHLITGLRQADNQRRSPHRSDGAGVRGRPGVAPAPAPAPGGAAHDRWRHHSRLGGLQSHGRRWVEHLKNTLRTP